MVTFHYFFNYFVLLVLQSSVFLYAQEPPIPSATAPPEPLPTLSPAVDENLPSASNETLSQANLTAAEAPQLNTTNTTDTLNIQIAKEFPQSPQNGTPYYYLNKTQEVPPPNPQKIDTELGDLLNNTNDIAHPANEISDQPPNITLDKNFNDAVELIEDGDNTEDVLRSESHQQVDTPAVPLVQGQLAAILAAVFVVISVVAYFALLSWRRYLENRYGNRQMLVNEDELNDRDDMRYFSI